MKKNRNRDIFLDANVICDYVLMRKHHTRNANAIIENAQKLFLTLHVSSYSFAIAYHFMRRQKNISHIVALDILGNLFRKVKCISVDGNIVQQAMKSGFQDYEDAIQYGCALAIPDCEFIITRDTKDFALSDVPVIIPQTFIRRYL
jgi:predicted nucleic acid-binding protein